MLPAPPGSTPVKDGISMKLVVHQVPPEYPFEARRSHITGHGILFGEIDYKTGNVTSVRMEKSTGSRILDQAALNAFRQWRFKPGTTRQFRTPINYEMVGSRAEAMEKMRRDQTASAQDVHVSQGDSDEIRAVIRAVTRAPILRFTPFYEQTDKVWVLTGSDANPVGGLYVVQKAGGKWQVIGKKHFWIH
jgi:TonB family protein